MLKTHPGLSRQAQFNATLSSCCGFTGEAVLTDSAVIILFAGILGAGDMFSMISTSLLPLFNGLLIIPMALMTNKIQGRKLILGSCVLATVAYLLAASAPFWGRFAVTVLISMVLLFALSLPGFIAGWFPMLDTFIADDRRTAFFSRMRFCHQLTAVVFLFAIGFLLGSKPEVWKLQAAIFCGAIVFAGRALFIARIPVVERQTAEPGTIKKDLWRALKNSPLLNFSIYFFILNLASWGTIPLMTIYLKSKLQAPDNLIVFMSGLTLTGMLTGYLVANKLIRLLGVKTMLYLIHISFIAVNTVFFFIPAGNVITYVVISILLTGYSMMVAISTIIIAGGMMALATPDNKRLTMALCGAFCYTGSGLSRFLSSILLGAELLVVDCYLGPLRISHYQVLFLGYAIALVLALLWLKLKMNKCVLDRIG